MRNYIIIHYSEIGLKGANAPYFINKLRLNIKRKLEKEFKETYKITFSLSRFIVLLEKDFDKEKYIKVLSKIFGIKNFKFVFEGSLEIEKLGKEIWENLDKDEIKDSETFKVKVKRAMKLDFKSFEAERELGAILLENGINKQVKMKNPDLIIDVEFLNNAGYFSFKKHKGLGGMPANTQSKLVSLLSSGIDSPVASFQLMRRGARVIFAHFHGYPYTDKEEMQQVKEIVKILSDYQSDTKLYLIPFGQIQREIATTLKIPAKIRTVLYRRTMLRIAEKIAQKEKAKGLITGDNYGQVASQTPENIFAIHEISKIPVFQPLIGLDKEEIIEKAKEIETYDVSKLLCKDACTMFMPRNPELKANLLDVLEYEKLLPIDELIKKVINESEII